MTLSDIPNSGNDRNQSAIVQELRPLVEPLFRWQLTYRDSSVARDSVRRALYTSIRQLNASPQKDNPEQILLKGLLWHYLYQLEVDSAFSMADSLATRVMRLCPQMTEAAWLKGINLIRAARIKRGFAILDSLRTGDRIQNSDFMSDYTKLSVQCFLPLRHSRLDSLALFLFFADSGTRATMNEEEVVPFSETWRVSAKSFPAAEMPELTFTASYTLYQPLLLMFPPYNPNSFARLKIAVDNNMFHSVKEPLLYDPELLKYRMEITITADCNGPACPLNDYMRLIVSKDFDAVKQINDLPLLHAISLRCHNRSVFRNVPGESCAFVAFDLKLSGNSSGSVHESKKLPSGKDDDLVVRYLIAMKTSDVVEEKAEAIFQDLLCQFAGFKY
jgi:hypothetical protein